jgi:hypothetical protein
MNVFPAVDPIPLPAPVWLFKALHVLTLALHFITVEMMLGALLVAVWLSFLGTSQRGAAASGLRLNAAAAIGRRLPILMTFVINLGVPPLLFAQVLYGRALYTSSVLIGMYWIAVIFLLMACYWLLYRFSARMDAGKSAWWLGGLAYLLAIGIARIYSTNMTLMLRPEVWQAMYSASAGGNHLPPYDPTLTPRWLFMLTGGFWVAGLWMLWMAGRKTIEEPVRRYLGANGGRLAAVMALAQVALAFVVFMAQPAAVQSGLKSNMIYQIAGWLWLATVAMVFLFGAWAAMKKPISRAVGYGSMALTLVAMLAMAVYRDGLRDLTLLGCGYDVWDRVVVTNWSVVVIFLVVFVAGLGGAAWLVSVMMRAKPVAEKVA